MKNWWKWLLGFLTLIIVVILVGTWYLSKNWKPIIEEKLKEIVHKSSNGLYTLQYLDLDVNVPFGNITLDSVELVPNSMVYAELTKAKKAPNNQYHIKLDALKIKHFSLTNLFFNRKLSISNIEFDGPNVHLIHEYHAYNDTISNQPKGSLFDQIKHLFSSVAVKTISVDSINFSYTNVLPKQKNQTFKVKGVSVHVDDILIDSLSAKDPDRLFYTKAIDVKVPKFEYTLPAGFYKVGFDKLHLNTKNKNLSLHNVVFKPTMSRDRFFRLKGYNVAITDLKFSEIALNGLDFERMLNKQQFVGTSLNINNGVTAFYQNLAYPFDVSSRIGKAPYQQMMKIKSIFHFNTVNINNVDVLYSERSAKYDNYGVITFNGTKGTLTNVTNDRTLLSKNKFMRADLRTRVMNSGTLHVKFGFDMLSKGGYYTYAGSLTPMQAPAFNKILIPLVNVQIASGNIHSITFDMQGTDYKNWGIFKFKYDSLKVDILTMAKDGQVAGSKKAISYIVNKVLVNESNPDRKGIYHVGLVEYTRVPSFPFFKTMWQSLLQGIVQSVGISAKTEARLLGAASTSGKVIEELGKVVKGTEQVAVAVGKEVGKVGKAVGKEVGKDAKIVGKEIGKETGKIVHGTDSLFKKVFKKKKKNTE